MKKGSGVPRPIVLIICDGLGHNPKEYGNAISKAKKPTLDYLKKNYPTTTLKCSGKNVGLPPGTMGNSEVGHIHMGCGTHIFQPLQMVNNAIEDGTFFKNEALMKAVEHTRTNSSALHIMGLFSDKGVHSTVLHLHALLDLCKREKVKKVFIHPFLDGRDVPERSCGKYFSDLDEHIKKTGVGVVASIVGRYYAMDRDTNWDRTEKAYELLTKGEGFKETDTKEAILNAYKRGDKTDYYVQPIVMVNEKKEPVGLVKDKDAIVFFNYRSDRARQITNAMMMDSFSGFKRNKLKDICFVCMSVYDKKFGLPVAYKQLVVKKNLAGILADNKLTQLRIAETEKYAHVTFFFNSQVEKPYEFEDRILVNSPKVKSYDLQPEMSAPEVTKKLVEAIKTNKYDCVMCNYANCDLVGHSGVFEAAVAAVEEVDKSVKQVVDATLELGGLVMVTADHGNADEMLYPNGEVNPAHSLNPVPFIFVTEDKELKGKKLRQDAELVDVTPTILELLKIKQPDFMNGKSLLMK